jgi:hypothetical protein
VCKLTTNENECFHDEKMMKRAGETRVERSGPYPSYVTKLVPGIKAEQVVICNFPKKKYILLGKQKPIA